MIVLRNIKDITWTAAVRLTIASQTKCPFHAVNYLIARQVPGHRDLIKEVKTTTHSVTDRAGYERLDVAFARFQRVQSMFDVREFVELWFVGHILILCLSEVLLPR